MKRSLHGLIAGLSLAFGAAALAQGDAAALLSEGNSLAKSGLWHAAMLRYREAAAAGADSALFHYNVGIVAYRLGRLDDAADELTLASLDPRLEGIATYNLGLVELERDDRQAAAAAFQHVVDIGADRPLRRSARERLDEISAASRVAAVTGETAARARRAVRDDEPRGGFRFSTLARYAQDSNVYQAPADPYVDQSDPAAPVVTPVVYSAAFMPVALRAEYVVPNESGDTEFSFGYALDGDFYETEFANANRVTQQFSIGADIDLQSQEQRRRRLTSAFFMRTHDETNFNPDDGLDRTLAGTDIADRFVYRAAGIRIDYGHEIGRFEFGFDVDYERRQYEDAGLLPNYDHNAFENHAFVDVSFGPRNEVGFGLRSDRRIYDERLARDLTGALSTGPDFVEYDYQGIDLGYRRLIGRSLLAEIEFRRLERTDAFVGYYDYTQNAVIGRITYRPNPKFTVWTTLSARDYEFPRAFAFNNPLAGARELESTGTRVELQYALTRKLALWLEVDAYSTDANDQREAYDRSLAMIGVRWRHD